MEDKQINFCGSILMNFRCNCCRPRG